MMNTISIHVPDSLARVYNHADENKKKRAEQYINAWLTNFLNSKSSNDKITEIMKRVSDTAKSNGLTPEILEDLLKDEE